MNCRILKEARKAGFLHFYFGLETSIPRLLKLIQKGVDIKTAEAIIKNCCKLDLSATVNFIIGLPTQTKEELKRDLDFMLYLVKTYKNIRPSVHFLKILPGSLLAKEPQRYGIKIVGKRPIFCAPLTFKQINKNALSPEEAYLIYSKFFEKNSSILDQFITAKPQIIAKDLIFKAY